MPARELNAVVSERREVNPRLLILRVAPDGWALPDFVPGQYATIGLPAGAPRWPGAAEEENPSPPERVLLRAYSIASSSRAKEYIELYVNLVDSGSFTPRLFALQPGDRLYLKPGFKGVFTLAEVPADQDVVLVATGTGLAPYMSMLRSHAADGGPRRYAVLLGARYLRDLGYDAELRALAAAHPAVSYHPIVSRPEAPWAGPVGRVQDLWRAGVVTDAWGRRPTPADTHVFLCGNPGMIDAMRAQLTAEGFVEQQKLVPGQIHVEVYW